MYEHANELQFNRDAIKLNKCGKCILYSGLFGTDV